MPTNTIIPEPISASSVVSNVDVSISTTNPPRESTVSTQVSYSTSLDANKSMSATSKQSSSRTSSVSVSSIVDNSTSTRNPVSNTRTASWVSSAASPRTQSFYSSKWMNSTVKNPGSPGPGITTIFVPGSTSTGLSNDTQSSTELHRTSVTSVTSVSSNANATSRMRASYSWSKVSMPHATSFPSPLANQSSVELPDTISSPAVYTPSLFTPAPHFPTAPYPNLTFTSKSRNPTEVWPSTSHSMPTSISTSTTRDVPIEYSPITSVASSRDIPVSVSPSTSSSSGLVANTTKVTSHVTWRRTSLETSLSRSDGSRIWTRHSTDESALTRLPDPSIASPSTTACSYETAETSSREQNTALSAGCTMLVSGSLLTRCLAVPGSTHPAAESRRQGKVLPLESI